MNVTRPEEEENWLNNFRIADIVLLTLDRFHIDKNEYMVGPPLVVVEIHSPGDETYDKFPFYAGLGVPEVWVFDRDTRVPELHELAAGPAYRELPAQADGWVRCPATGVEFKSSGNTKVAVRIDGDPATLRELPDV